MIIHHIKSEPNTYGLPEGEDVRRELVRWFRAQRKHVLSILAPPLKAQQDPSDLGGGGVPDQDWWRLGALAESERMTPLIEGYWDAAGAAFRTRIGLDPDGWQVTNPNTQEAIQTAALEFCEATNATTSLSVDEAIRRTREELEAGVIQRGESIRTLTQRINEVFDQAEKYRARRIAQTETARAVHAAQEMAAEQSGVVQGWQWLLSTGACPICYDIAESAEYVRLGETFAIVGNHPTYSTVRHPPAHPGCRCTVLEVLLPAYGGPASPPRWADGPIVQPGREPAEVPA